MQRLPPSVQELFEKEEAQKKVDAYELARGIQREEKGPFDEALAEVRFYLGMVSAALGQVRQRCNRLLSRLGFDAEADVDYSEFFNALEERRRKAVTSLGDSIAGVCGRRPAVSDEGVEMQTRRP